MDHYISAILFTLLQSFHYMFISDAFHQPSAMFHCNKSSGECLKLESPSLTKVNQSANANGEDLAVCSLNCANYGTLWPRPTGITKLGASKSPIDINQIFLLELTWQENIMEIFNLFTEKLKQMLPSDYHANEGLGVAVSISMIQNGKTTTGDQSPFQTDESYSLSISKCPTARIEPVRVEIVGYTVQGIRHGLETLLQLTAYNNHEQLLYILCDTSIEDRPVYRYRGISIDVARRFYPLASLKRLMDGMSHSKMNYLHLHLTDAQSFPVQLDSHPEMAYYGAYDSDKVYTKQDLALLNRYAQLRGITIIPEIDTPSHVGEGWEGGDELGYGKLLLCYPGLDQLGPPWGTLNPLNANVHFIIQMIYEELLQIFGREDYKNIVHIGGDEVWMECWRRSSIIKEYIEDQQNLLRIKFPNATIPSQDQYLQHIWEDFEIQVLKDMKISNKEIEPISIMWSSQLTNHQNFPKNLGLSNSASKIIVEDWGAFDVQRAKRLLHKNVDLILTPSNYWYLDCGTGSWVGKGMSWCGSYKDWRTIYDLPISAINDHTNSSKPSGKLLGGEACIWSEAISNYTLDEKVWPRAAAIAERLWTDPTENWPNAHLRLIGHRNRLWKLGVQAESLQPEWCDYQGKKCINQ